MIRAYFNYEEWEDYQSGMYDELSEGREERIILAAKLLSDEKLCKYWMSEVLKRWKIATAQTLSNTSNNSKAWLGQSACHLYAGVKEDETRKAWGTLTEDGRKKANKIAADLIENWRTNYEGRCG